MNTAIFIDYDNVFITLEKYYERFDRLRIQETVLDTICKSYAEDTILLNKAFLDFHNIKISTEGFELFKKRFIELVHVYSGTNTSDISLIMDAMKTIYRDKIDIDKFVIISSDSDMFPLLKELKMLGKQTELYYFGVNTNEDYIKIIKGSGIKAETIEGLLGLEIYKNTEEEGLTITEEDYLKQVVNLINDRIEEIYISYLKKEAGGKITKAGVCNKGNLRDFLVDKKVFIKMDIINGSAIEYLFKEGIIHEYKTPQGYNAILLNEKYITDNALGIEAKITKDNYDF